MNQRLFWAWINNQATAGFESTSREKKKGKQEKVKGQQAVQPFCKLHTSCTTLFVTTCSFVKNCLLFKHHLPIYSKLSCRSLFIFRCTTKNLIMQAVQVPAVSNQIQHNISPRYQFHSPHQILLVHNLTQVLLIIKLEETPPFHIY